MSQHDYDIANQSFPAFRTDLNNVLGAINTSNSGTSRPSGAVAGTIWLDTTSATTPTLKFYDGADDISLATLDYTANTVNWLDSTVVFDIVGDTTPQLGGDLDVNGNSLVSTSNGNITFTPDGTGKVIIDGLSHPTADGSNGQALVTDGSGNLSFAAAGLSGWSEDGVNNNLLPASASAGIYLGVATATAANLLDDYEEGTFTPDLKIGGSTTGISYGARTGSYTKIGNIVTANIYVYINSKGSETGSVTITGLPFSSTSDNSIYQTGSLYNDRIATPNGSPQGILNPNASLINLYQTSTGTSNNGTLTNSQLTDTSFLLMNFNYKTNA